MAAITGDPVQMMNNILLLKQELDIVKEQQKNKKVQLDQQSLQLRQMMIQHRKVFVDQSNAGTGPFWSLIKKTAVDKNLTDEDFQNLYRGMMTDISNGINVTQELFMERVKKMRSDKGEKRKLDLEPRKTRPAESFDELERWCQGL